MISGRAAGSAGTAGGAGAGAVPGGAVPGTTGGLGARGCGERQWPCGRGEGAGLRCRRSPGIRFLGWGYSGGTGEGRVFAELLGLEETSRDYPLQLSAQAGSPTGSPGAGYPVAHQGGF